MKKFSQLIIVSLYLLVSACAKVDGQQPGSGTVNPDSPASENWEVNVITDQLAYPWEIRRAGNELFITETEGNIVVIDSARRLKRYHVETSTTVSHLGGVD